MAFLDNSGDIILDAVLTDAGRQRLARADGTFRITQFALGDDEINYELYDTSAETALADVEILKTPVFEAFTNNIASLNSKLMTVPRTDLMYLPVIKLNEKINSHRTAPAGVTSITNLDSLIANSFVVCADTTTFNAYIKNINSNLYELLEYTIYGHAANSTNASATTKIKLDQGLLKASGGYTATQTIDGDLKETQYIVEIDNRLGSLVSTKDPSKEAAKSFVDDDGIASYYFGLATDMDYVSDLAVDTDTNIQPNMVILGPRGTSLQFTIKSSIDLQTSGYYFDLLSGAGIVINTAGASIAGAPENGKKAQVIRSNIVVTGVTTGYSVTIPVSYLKIS